jgi:hypothetical protein
MIVCAAVKSQTNLNCNSDFAQLLAAMTGYDVVMGQMM